MTNWKSIAIKKETYDYILDEVKKVYLKHHPELKGSNITINTLLLNALEFYVND